MHARVLERKEQPHLKSEGFGNLRLGSLRPVFDHCDTGTGECIHRIGEHRTSLSGDRRPRIIQHHTSPESIELMLPRRRQHPGQRLRRRLLRTRRHPKRGAQVSSRTRQRSDRRHIARLSRQRWWARWLETGQWHHPNARPQPVNATEAGRDPDRAHQIRAVIQEAKPNSDRSRGAAGRAARSARDIPRIVGHPVQLGWQSARNQQA